MPTKALVLLSAFLLAICEARASNTLVDRLNVALERNGVERVNQELVDKWDEEMMPLMKGTMNCVSKNIILTNKLRATSNATALSALTASLQAAMQKCPEVVLSQIVLDEVSLICSAADSADTYPKMSEEEILKRRIKRVAQIQIKHLEEKKKMCIDSYRVELQSLEARK